MVSKKLSVDAHRPDVRDEGHPRQLRLPYETPHIEIIDLTVQEVLGGCVKLGCGGVSISMS
jgi:hypothetical protein